MARAQKASSYEASKKANLCLLLVSCLVHPLILKMETMRTSETLAKSYRITRCYTAEDIHCHVYHIFSMEFPFFHALVLYNLTASDFGIQAF
jgi:hypothetical protein